MGFFLPATHLMPSRLQRLRDQDATRNALWNRFYGNDWGDVTTNNYGFAPADSDEIERFQFQMYYEHLKALQASGRAGQVVWVCHELTAHTRRALLDGVADAVINQDAGHEVRSAVRVALAQLCGERVVAAQRGRAARTHWDSLLG